MLEVKDLVVYYGKALALSGVDVRIEEGELVAIVGPNGAGKSTLFKAASGLIRPSQGSIVFDGVRVDKLLPHKIVRLGLVQCPERRRLAPDMRVIENLELGAYLRKDKDGIKNDLKWVYTLFPILEKRQNQITKTLSGGEQQMLAIARALMSKPKLLMLDEPLLGLAPIVKTKIIEVIRGITGQGVTVFMAEQDAVSAFKVAKRAYVLENGRIVLEGPAEGLVRNEHVKSTYLGL